MLCACSAGLLLSEQEGDREREIYIYMCVYIYCICMYVYIYIYIERENTKEEKQSLLCETAGAENEHEVFVLELFGLRLIGDKKNKTINTKHIPRERE